MRTTYRNIAIAQRRIQQHLETTTYTKEKSREKALLDEVYTVLEQVSGSELRNECFITRDLYYLLFESGVGIFQNVDFPSLQLTYRTVEAQVRVVIYNDSVEIYREDFSTNTKVNFTGDPRPKLEKTIIHLNNQAREIPYRLVDLRLFEY